MLGHLKVFKMLKFWGKLKEEDSNACVSVAPYLF